MIVIVNDMIVMFNVMIEVMIVLVSVMVNVMIFMVKVMIVKARVLLTTGFLPFKLELVDAVLDGTITGCGRATPRRGGVLLRGTREVGGASMQRPSHTQDLNLIF